MNNEAETHLRVLRINAHDLAVTNAEAWDELPADDEDTLFRASLTGEIGDIYDPATGAFTTPTVAAPVPAEISMLQARLALAHAGLLAIVQTAISSADEQTQLYWEYASGLHRDHPLVATLSAALHLTSSQIDDLFRAAAKIV